MIDIASAPMPWHSRWDGWRGGRGRGKRCIMLHLQPRANLVNPELRLFPFHVFFFNLSPSLIPLVISSSLLHASSISSLSCMRSFLFHSLSLSLFTCLVFCSPSLYLSPLSPLVFFLAGPAVLLSKLTSARMGQLLQWSCLLLALAVEREEKHSRGRWRSDKQGGGGTLHIMQVRGFSPATQH